MKTRTATHILSIALLCAGSFTPAAADDDDERERMETIRVVEGNLSVLLRDNSRSPAVLSGVQSLFHVGAAKDFDAYDPDTPGASAGLNFEHIISGHPDKANAFTPRHGEYGLYRLARKNRAVLVRKAGDSPWAMASTFEFTVTGPEAIDFEFRCRPQNPARFGERGYAVLFFANYMNDVADVALHFRGVEGPGERETWIRAEAPPGHRDYRGGGTYRSLRATDLEYDRDHNFKLNLWSYDYPRFTQPFFYGRAARDMVLILMFDRLHSERDEIRFSLFKFKVPRHPRPAWDFQYVIHKVEKAKRYGFRGRLLWKKYVSPEDCLAEYRRWKASLEREGTGQGWKR